jgi:hemerythrin
MKFEEEKHLLNYDNMDQYHLEFVEIYNSVDTSSNESYINVTKKLLAQTKIHFRKEEDLMIQYNYSRKKEHMDEHNKVLAEMEYFISKSNTKMGMMMLKSYFNEKLPSWFDLHLISMDSDLAYHIKNNS